MSIELTSQVIFGGAILTLLCVFASVVSRRLGAPILLVFLVLGMLAGEDGPGGIHFNNYGIAFLVGNLALAVIVFDGGLGTRRETFRVSLKPAIMLATLGVVITAGLTGLAAYWILALPWMESLLVGAIVGSTDAAAVFGLLRFAGLELKERTSATLEIESGTNDPMAIFLTLTFVQILTVAESAVGMSIATELIQQMGLGLAAGFSGGFLLTGTLKRIDLPISLVPLFVLAGGLSVFGVTNLFGGSGFLAIFIVGVITGNTSLPHGNDIHRFHDGIAWLSQIGMFLMLGLLITPSHLPPIILPAIALALVLIFLARPTAVLVSLLPFHFPWREQVFISWCGLRGAVPIILALFPSLAGLEHTETFFELVFFVVLVSLILQGWTIAPLARWLGINLPASAHDPKHLTLYLPKNPDKELRIYDVATGSKAIGLRNQRLPLPRGTQLVGVIRHGVMVESDEKFVIKADDQLMLLTTPDSTGRLYELFTPRVPVLNNDLPTFYGEFIITPSATLKELSQLYGFEPPPVNEENISVADYINKTFHGKAVVGDSVSRGSIQFIVKTMKDNCISQVGLKLNPK
jgi:cell volume regulation protein A